MAQYFFFLVASLLGPMAGFAFDVHQPGGQRPIFTGDQPVIYRAEEKKEKDRVDLSHIPKELLKFGLLGLVSEKDRKALKDHDCEPEIHIGATSFKGVTNKEIMDLVLKPVREHFKGKKIYDFGGGYSKLLPYLRKGEMESFSLDPAYGEKEEPPEHL